MGVSRSGYYKWKKRDKSARDLRREEVIALVSQVHEAHPSHGYRWVAAFIRINHQQNIIWIGSIARYKIQFASLMQAGERWQIPRWSCPLLLAQYFQRLRPGR